MIIQNVDPSITPDNERDRQTALRRYEILDTPSDGAFDSITALIAKLLDVPIAIVSLVDNDRIWFKSHHGLDIQQIDRDPGLCASVILNDAPYIVEDAKVDPRTLTNPLVAEEFGLRFYAGSPLKTHDGYNLGTLCCLDFKPRTLSSLEIDILESFARIVMDQMELRIAARQIDKLHIKLTELNKALEEKASRDMLTELWNRRAVLELLDQNLARAIRDHLPLSILMLDIDHFKSINDTYGHPVGDQVLKTVAESLSHSLRKSDTIGRLGGEEFLCILPACAQQEAFTVAERCRRSIENLAIVLEGSNKTISISVSIGLFTSDEHFSLNADEMIIKADAALYHSKQQGRNLITIV